MPSTWTSGYWKNNILLEKKKVCDGSFTITYTDALNTWAWDEKDKQKTQGTPY